MVMTDTSESSGASAPSGYPSTPTPESRDEGGTEGRVR